MLLVAGFPALTAMTAEVVPAAIRGLTFSVTSFLAALASAASPLLIGAIADQFNYNVDGKVKGNLAYAFLIVTPLVLIGGLVVLARSQVRRGRHAAAPPRSAPRSPREHRAESSES